MLDSLNLLAKAKTTCSLRFSTRNGNLCKTLLKHKRLNTPLLEQQSGNSGGYGNRNGQASDTKPSYKPN